MSKKSAGIQHPLPTTVSPSNFSPIIHPLVFCGQSIKFSPYHSDVLAVGTAQYFGIVGNGKQYVLNLSPRRSSPTFDGALVPTLTEVTSFDTQDGVFDCTWSESNEHVLASAMGDGSIKIWDTNPYHLAPRLPISNLTGHTKEVSSVDWNIHIRSLILSASWDSSVRVWDIEAPGGSNTVRCEAHTGVAYAGIWSPTQPRLFASVGADGRLQLFDLNVGGNGHFSSLNPSLFRAVQSIQAHTTEILSIDWNKYNTNQVVTGGIDCKICVWDLRTQSKPLFVLHGHSLAVRRVKCNPHHERFIASASYDMSVCIWDTTKIGAHTQTLSDHQPPLMRRFTHHREFVIGLDWCLFHEKLLCSTAWDKTVCMWNAIDGPAPPLVPKVGSGRAF